MKKKELQVQFFETKNIGLKHWIMVKSHKTVKILVKFHSCTILGLHPLLEPNSTYRNILAGEICVYRKYLSIVSFLSPSPSSFFLTNRVHGVKSLPQYFFRPAAAAAR